MKKTIQIVVFPGKENEPEYIKKRAARKAGIPLQAVSGLVIKNKSIDARLRPPKIRLAIEVFTGEEPPAAPDYTGQFANVSDKEEVIIVGAGPAGYFAALQCLEVGLKPIIFERGKKVRHRRKDLKAIIQESVVNPDSNYCFGEGGAGTYSDGKLYTRAHKRGNIYKILKLFVEHGASPDILVDSNPHIGSNKLPRIIENIRHTIIGHGGKIHFESRVTGFVMEKGTMKGVIVNDKQEHTAKATILATGHSARDIYRLCERHGISMEAKPFALGVRVEHPQPLIDKIQYGQVIRSQHLPAANYKLTCQVDNRGVYSFCMCPGGIIVPAMTNQGEIVVNGMSLARRNSPYANSGVVVEIGEKELKSFRKHGVFAGIALQQKVEQGLFAFGDGSIKAPAQRLTDFVHAKSSADLPASSYVPGIYSAPLHDLLPAFIAHKLKKALVIFDKKMRGYYTREAVVVGTESRTSSPIRLPRDPKTKMHIHVSGLFPAGEGAGYAGGILSAAMDGQNVVKAIGAWVK